MDVCLVPPRAHETQFHGPLCRTAQEQGGAGHSLQAHPASVRVPAQPPPLHALVLCPAGAPTQHRDGAAQGAAPVSQRAVPSAEADSTRGAWEAAARVLGQALPPRSRPEHGHPWMACLGMLLLALHCAHDGFGGRRDIPKAVLGCGQACLSCPQATVLVPMATREEPDASCMGSAGIEGRTRVPTAHIQMWAPSSAFKGSDASALLASACPCLHVCVCVFAALTPLVCACWPRRRPVGLPVPAGPAGCDSASLARRRQQPAKGHVP